MITQIYIRDILSCVSCLILIMVRILSIVDFSIIPLSSHSTQKSVEHNRILYFPQGLWKALLRLKKLTTVILVI